MTLDKIISHALEQCSIYGEYEFERIPLRIVVYRSGLQAWYVPGDDFEWVPVSADFVIDQLHSHYCVEAPKTPPCGATHRPRRYRGRGKGR